MAGFLAGRGKFGVRSCERGAQEATKVRSEQQPGRCGRVRQQRRHSPRCVLAPSPPYAELGYGRNRFRSDLFRADLFRADLDRVRAGRQICRMRHLRRVGEYLRARALCARLPVEVLIKGPVLSRILVRTPAACGSGQMGRYPGTLSRYVSGYMRWGMAAGGWGGEP